MSTAACLDPAPITLRSTSLGPTVRPVRPVDHECKACGGAGRCDCHDCHGTGIGYPVERSCPSCRGTGVSRDTCDDCGGSGEREPLCRDCDASATHKRGDTFLCAACLEDSDEH